MIPPLQNWLIAALLTFAVGWVAAEGDSMNIDAAVEQESTQAVAMVRQQAKVEHAQQIAEAWHEQ